MKNFDELLADNGIHVPAEPAKPNFIQKLLFARRMDKFHEKWDNVENKYEYLVSASNQEMKYWQICNDTLNGDWGIEMPPLEVPVLVFNNPSEASKAISIELQRINTLNLFHIQRELANSARIKWVSELIANMPTRCSLIVVKSKSYIPRPENIEQFEQFISNGKEACISMIFSPVWIAFYPTSEIDSRFWAVTKNNSTVQYITD